jgi:hypothetical protein
MSLQRKKEEKHEFHFVIGRKMRNSLEQLNVFKEPMGLSGIIVRILTALTPVIKVEHTWGKQRKSKYKPVTDIMEEREHVHAYLDEDIYRELKLVHHDLNFYSIAQIVRMFLGLFLRLVDKYGNDIFRVLEKLQKRWKEKVKENHLTLRKKLRHLYKIIRSNPGKHELLTVYDTHFTPFWMLRL